MPSSNGQNPGDPKFVNRVYRHGSEYVKATESGVGPQRNWYTLEIDIIPPSNEPGDPYPNGRYMANIINRHTGNVVSYEAHAEDYADLYPETVENPYHTRDELIHGEAIGTLMARVRDDFDTVTETDKWSKRHS